MENIPFELLSWPRFSVFPINKQEKDIIKAINQSYNNTFYANATVTGYLKSLRKIKKTQQEVLSIIGMEDIDSLITKNLVQTSEKISDAIDLGNEIDIYSEEALMQIEKITNIIKGITNNN